MGLWRLILAKPKDIPEWSYNENHCVETLHRNVSAPGGIGLYTEDSHAQVEKCFQLCLLPIAEPIFGDARCR